MPLTEQMMMLSMKVIEESQLITFWISLEKLLLMRVRRSSQTKMMLLKLIWRTLVTSLLGFTINKALVYSYIF